MLEGVLMPFMTAAYETGKSQKAREQLNWTIKLVGLGFTIGSIAVVLLSPILFDWILEGRYNDGLAVLPLTLTYCIWTGIAMLGQSYLWVAEKGKWVMAVTGLALAANIGLNIVLIPMVGLWGAVIATSIASFALMVLILELNRWIKCPTDIGVWVTAIFPLVLILPLAAMLPVVVGVCLAGFKTNWIFTADEKALLLKESRKILQKARAFRG